MSHFQVGWAEYSITPDKTEKAEKGGHYSGFLASGLVGHQGSEQLVRESVHAINAMFSD